MSVWHISLIETEKYAHVTFFFNGGVEHQFELEDRKLIPSPKVATYDLQPEMSCFAVADEVWNIHIANLRSVKKKWLICHSILGDEECKKDTRKHHIVIIMI